MSRLWMPAAFALIVAAAPAVVRAQVYVWKSQDGTLHFSDTPAHRGFKPFVQDTEAPRRRSRVTPGASDWDRAQVRDAIWSMAEAYGMDPRLVEAVVYVESSYDPFAVSYKGAMGLMQLMPDTAAELGVAEPFDPLQNLDGGMRYLRQLLDRFRGQIDLALAAYHAGESRVVAAGGIPAIEATQEYVLRILTLYEGAQR